MKSLLAALGIGCCVVLVGCGGSSTSGASPVGPAPVAFGAKPAGHEVAVSRGSLHSATLDVTAGASTLDISSRDLGGSLVAAQTPQTSGQRPTIAVSQSGIATVGLASIGAGGGPSVVNVILARSVRWTVDLDGGATTERVDLQDGNLAVIDLAAGVTRATIDLPAQRGTQLVRETGGASDLTVRVPDRVAVRADVAGGASSVQIRGTTHTGVGGTNFVDPGYARAADRLDLALIGGVSAVVVASS